MHQGQDWDTVVIRKKGGTGGGGGAAKGSALNSAMRSGAAIDTSTKYGAASNRSANSTTGLNTMKLDNETEELSRAPHCQRTCRVRPGSGAPTAAPPTPPLEPHWAAWRGPACLHQS
mmetsp:Transcript_45777/g.145923  ORF Transcript_45777/g.145923 Transcript_45777/m.145923 type:complete len:117 (-) Transcript_45777:648-998(-)